MLKKKISEKLTSLSSSIKPTCCSSGLVTTRDCLCIKSDLKLEGKEVKIETLTIYALQTPENVVSMHQWGLSYCGSGKWLQRNITLKRVVCCNLVLSSLLLSTSFMMLFHMYKKKASRLLNWHYLSQSNLRQALSNYFLICRAPKKIFTLEGSPSIIRMGCLGRRLLTVWYPLLIVGKHLYRVLNTLIKTLCL